MTPLTPIPSHADYDPPPEYLRQGHQLAPVAPTDRRGGWGRVLAVLLAMVTLSAFAGGVWVAYDMGVRKGLGLTPPLVRADPNPTKIVPVEPGGLVVANQDKRVFETIAAVEAPPRIEQLLPPPEVPLPPPAPEPRITVAAVVPTPVPDAAPASVPAVVAEAPNGVPVLPREALPEPPPIGGGAPMALLPPARPVSTPLATPAQPPAAVAPAPHSAAVTPATPPGPQAARPAAGAFRVQFGAYGDQTIALGVWETLKKKHGEMLAGMQPTVVAATVQGRNFQRLQAGPLASAAAANQLCAQLKAGGTDCLVVRP